MVARTWLRREATGSKPRSHTKLLLKRHTFPRQWHEVTLCFLYRMAELPRAWILIRARFTGKNGLEGTIPVLPFAPVISSFLSRWTEKLSCLQQKRNFRNWVVCHLAKAAVPLPRLQTAACICAHFRNSCRSVVRHGNRHDHKTEIRPNQVQSNDALKRRVTFEMGFAAATIWLTG